MDGQWYRGRIQTVNQSTFEILFIDYGSVEECKKSNVRSIHTFGSLPQQAQECQFAFIDIEKCELGGDIRVGIITKREGVNQALVYDRDGCVNIELVREGLATMKRMRLPIAGKSGTISSVLHSIHDAQELAKKDRVITILNYFIT